MTLLRRCWVSAGATCALALVTAGPALGATHTWIGPTNGLWSNAANWTGGKPTNGESGGTIVQFGANTSSSMDIAGLTIDQIHFTGANNTIGGSTTLTISGASLVQNVISDAAGNTLSSTLHIALAGATLEAASNAGTLTIAGPVSGTQGLAFVSGGGEFALTGNNTYAGATSILAGALHIATPEGAVIVGSSIVIGSGLGAGAQLVLDQSSDISPTTAVTVNSDGLWDFRSHSDFAQSLTVNGGSVVGANLKMSGALVMKGGTVTIGNAGLSAGSLSMTGGNISAPSTGVLALAGDIQATSSPAAPATIASGVRLSASTTVTVTPGNSPELRVTGAISETGGARAITKAGTGTMVVSADNSYTGTTTVTAGTLMTNGTQLGAFSVGQNGTLGGSGTLGATTVAGVLAPAPPGLHTGALSFAPTGRLAITLTSIAPGAIPTTIATGAVAIDPSATLNLVVATAPGSAIPHGTNVVLIDNDAADAIGGQFAGLPANSVFNTADGVPLAISYAGGDGNDLGLLAGNIPPQVGSIVAAPNPATVGGQVALSVTASDTNQDPLSTSWAFGDGTTGTGASTSHAYAAPGTYTVLATVSDGLAQVQSSTVITVSGPTKHSEPAPAGTSTVKSAAYGAGFALTAPKACIQAGAPFSVVLSVKKLKGKTHGSVLVRVTKVTFALGGKTFKTKRSAPFSVRLRIPRTIAPGSTIKLRTSAYLVLRSAKHRTKSITKVLTVC